MSPSEKPRVSTGLSGLDDILCGGLDPDCLYLVEGRHGAFAAGEEVLESQNLPPVAQRTLRQQAHFRKAVEYNAAWLDLAYLSNISFVVSLSSISTGWNRVNS